MKTIALAFVGLVLFAQEPAKKVDLSSEAHGENVQRTDAPAKVPTLEDLQAQVTQLQQTVAQKDAQIAQMQGYMQAEYVAFQKVVGACYQSLAEAEQRAAAKK